MRIGLKLLFVLLSINTVDVYSSDLKEFSHRPFNKIMGYIGQSHLLFLMNHLIYKNLYHISTTLLFSEQLKRASLEYNDLMEEAYKKLKISPSLYFPVYRFPMIKGVTEELPFLAVTTPANVLINETRLNHQTYGLKRSTSFHEAVHCKYFDPAFRFFCPISAGLTSFLISNQILSRVTLLKRFKITRMITSAILFGFTSIFINKKINYFTERRADIEGHYATECYQCVDESVQYKRNYYSETESNNGYLSAQELQAIVNDLQSQNALCCYHREHCTEKE